MVAPPRNDLDARHCTGPGEGGHEPTNRANLLFRREWRSRAFRSHGWIESDARNTVPGNSEKRVTAGPQIVPLNERRPVTLDIPYVGVPESEPETAITLDHARRRL